MQRDFLVESRSYDAMLRGSWQAYRLNENIQLSDEPWVEATTDALRLWLPRGTLMHWATGGYPLRYNCLQFFWPERWYMLSAFYNERSLIHTYAIVIQPPVVQPNRISYVDLDLSVLVKPDLTYEILTRAEFEQAAAMFDYDEDTRMQALTTLRTLTSSIQRSVGLFAAVPHCLQEAEFHRVGCSSRYM
jgi:protein associated with RNAse G/E